MTLTVHRYKSQSSLQAKFWLQAWTKTSLMIKEDKICMISRMLLWWSKKIKYALYHVLNLLSQYRWWSTKSFQGSTNLISHELLLSYNHSSESTKHFSWEVNTSVFTFPLELGSWSSWFALTVLDSSQRLKPWWEPCNFNTTWQMVSKN